METYDLEILSAEPKDFRDALKFHLSMKGNIKLIKQDGEVIEINLSSIKKITVKGDKYYFDNIPFKNEISIELPHIILFEAETDFKQS